MNQLVSPWQPFCQLRKQTGEEGKVGGVLRGAVTVRQMPEGLESEVDYNPHFPWMQTHRGFNNYMGHGTPHFTIHWSWEIWKIIVCLCIYLFWKEGKERQSSPQILTSTEAKLGQSQELETRFMPPRKEQNPATPVTTCRLQECTPRGKLKSAEEPLGQKPRWSNRGCGVPSSSLTAG